MASRQWTVMLVPEGGDTGVRQFRLSRELVRLTAAGACCVVAAAIAVMTVLVTSSGSDRADARLVAKNEVLERELGLMTARLDSLETSLTELSGRDEQYRLMAGLEPLDASVLMAGIGGPDDESLETSSVYQVDRRTGSRAYGASMQINTLLRRASVLEASWSEAQRVLAGKHARLAATPSIFPTKGHVSSSFTTSRWHPILDRPRPHMGIDIVAAVGTPVVATANGRVTAASNRGDYGLLVEIDHGHGVVTRYAHLSRAAVRVGQTVQRGQKIGAVGTSGLSAGPHLHYEVLVNGRYANPRRYILDSDVLPD